MLLTFITGVRFCAIIMVNFINGPRLTVWAVTVNKHKEDNLLGGTFLNTPLVTPSYGTD